MRSVITGLLVLASLAAAQDARPTDEVVKDLKEAFKTGDETIIDAAIRGSATIEDDAVIKQIARGLRHKSLAVRKVSIDTLGRMKSNTALKELQRLYFGNRSLSKNPSLFALLLQSIGRHGDKSSIRVFVDSVFRNLTLESGRARLYGLGNIRDDDAVEELIKLSRKAGGRQRGSGIQSEWRGVFQKDFHAAIFILTGEDFGRGTQDLEKWWRTWRKKDAPRVPAERPEVPPDISDLYEKYWGKNYYRDAKKKPPPASLQPPLEINDNPTPDEEKIAVSKFKDAFKGKDPDVIAHTIERYGGVVSDKVVHEVARGLRFRDRKVRHYAVIALGWVPNPNALRQLHRMYRREKKLGKEDEALFAELLKSIGRHRDKSSIKVLTDKPFKYSTLASTRARIYGVGNIRTKQSVEELIKGMRLVGSAGDRGPRAFATDEPRAMPEFNVALSVLTGTSLGPNQEAWQRWWRDNKRKFKISAERPQVPDNIQRTWENYWNEPY
ncbi:MAG: HEAT repeat domain-containing protein [Planctomycetota bacterium]